jgi:bifunctional NMN adenylyltransferase/nudix hydrolase
LKDYAFVIGRFQPYHKGHHALIHRAFQEADNVIVVIGDTGCRPDFRNPWTFEERKTWIEGIWESAKTEHQSIVCVQVEDAPYDDATWVQSVRRAVAAVLPTDAGKRVLVGHKKDASSFYLDLFPEWQFVEVAPQHTAGATFIRELFFREKDFKRVGNMLNGTVYKSIMNMGVGRFEELETEALAIHAHDLEWHSDGAMQYGVQHVAVDLLLYSDTHIALIERGGDVGGGALALPGGFVENTERLIEAALREAKEEIGFDYPRSAFPAHGIGVMIPFDHPRRSMRGRIFTNVLPVYVANHTKVELKAGDDAKKVDWYKRADLQSLKRRFFSDHWHIIDILLTQKGL